MLTVHVKFGNEREGHCKIQKEIESVQRTFEIYRVINKVIYIAYHRHFARSQRQKYKILALLMSRESSQTTARKLTLVNLKDRRSLKCTEVLTRLKRRP